MNLGEWRLKRQAGEPLTLPTGLDVMVRDADMMDLAATGNLPAPLMALIDEVQDTKKVKAEDFSLFLELLNKLTVACMISPKVVDKPTDAGDAICIDELAFKDKFFIFNWANREALALENFRAEQGEPVVAVQPE